MLVILDQWLVIHEQYITNSNSSGSYEFDSYFNSITLPINWSLGHAVAGCADVGSMYGESILIRAINNNSIGWVATAQRLGYLLESTAYTVRFIGVGY